MNNRNIPVLVGGDFNLDLRNFPAINEYPGNPKSYNSIVTEIF